MQDETFDNTVTAWIRLVRAHSASLALIDGRLKRAGLPPLQWYDVLLELVRGGPQGMRPRELEPNLLLPQYKLSRLLSRMEKAGLVTAQPCEQDGRGQIITITPDGRKTQKEMWKVYASGIKAVFAEKLNDTETKQLSELLARLLSPVAADGPPQ